MTKAEEATLALMGTAESTQKPWRAEDFNDDARVKALLAEGMAEIEDGALVVSVSGWNFLDKRTPAA